MCLAVSEAESAVEAVECQLDYDELVGGPAPEEQAASAAKKPAAAAAAADATKPGDERRSNLMGAAESLDQCISEAEGVAEAAECELDYDALVGGPDEK